MPLAKKIIIAGGGTGGHIFPAIAIANALKKISPDTEILFIGAKGKMEMEKIPQAGYKIEGIDIAGFNRSSIWKNITLPFKLIKSFFQVRNHLIRFMPDAVIGVGGYSSFPVLRYAQGRGIPTFIHEANSFAGKSNKLLSKKAHAVFVGGEGMEKFFPADKIIITGNPVRSEIIRSSITRNEASAFFSLDPSKTTVLSVGGSLGARSINEAMREGLDKLEAEGIQLIWQTGKEYAPTAAQAVKDRKGFFTSEFITRMDLAYKAADIVVSRAGAMAIAELAVVDKPVIFVPYPHAAENHQEVNATRLVEKDAGIMVTDANCAASLIDTVIELAKDQERQERMKNNIRAFSYMDADTRVAEEVFNRITIKGQPL